jgi:hypothetical protein
MMATYETIHRKAEIDAEVLFEMNHDVPEASSQVGYVIFSKRIGDQRQAH